MTTMMTTAAMFITGKPPKKPRLLDLARFSFDF